MKNKLTDLNNHLFAQLERLNDEDLNGEELDQEIRRSQAICNISEQIVSAANTVVKAAQIQGEYSSKPILPEYLGIGVTHE